MECALEHIEEPIVIFNPNTIITSKLTLPLSHESVKQYLNNNIQYLRNDRAFLNYLEHKQVDVRAHLLKKMSEVAYSRLMSQIDSYDALQSTTCLYEYFLDHAVTFELLEPVFSEFRERLIQTIYFQNYILEDESKDIKDQNEVIFYGKLKVQKTQSGLLNFFYRIRDEWKVLPQFDTQQFYVLGKDIKTPTFEHRKDPYHHTHELRESLARYVIADMLDLPHFAHSAVEKEAGTFAYDAEKLMSLFTHIISIKCQPYVNAPKDNRAYISAYSLANSLKKVDWVASAMLSPILVQYYKYFPHMKTLSLADHNDKLNYISENLELIKSWENDNIRKLCLITHTYKQNEITEKLKDPNALSYSNIIIKNDIDSHPTMLGFVDKRCYQNLIQNTPQSIFMMLAHNYLNPSRFMYFYTSKAFPIWTYYLAYSKHKKLNTHVFKAMFQAVDYNFSYKWYGNIPVQSKEMKACLNSIVTTLDAAYTVLLDAWKETKKVSAFYRRLKHGRYVELFDYLKRTENVNTLIRPIHMLNASKNMSAESLMRRVESWHTEMVEKRFTEIDYHYPHLDDFEMEIGQSKFTLLATNRDIYLEGRQMHHCVGSFTDRVITGQYLIFRIEGEDRATLGIEIKHNPVKLVANQCLSYCNQSVSVTTTKNVNKFMAYLNKNPQPWLNLERIPEQQPCLSRWEDQDPF